MPFSFAARTSLAVFLTFVALYFGTVVLPIDMAAKVTGWTAQAASMTGAVATFLAMHSYNLNMLRSVVVLAGAVAVTTVATWSIVTCSRDPQCTSKVAVHSLVLSSGIMMGAAAYAGYLIGSAFKLPLWATMVVSIMFAPLLIGIILPYLATKVNSLLSDKSS